MILEKTQIIFLCCCCFSCCCSILEAKCKINIRMAKMQRKKDASEREKHPKKKLQQSTSLSASRKFTHCVLYIVEVYKVGSKN